MGKLASISLPVVFVIICGQLALPTDATFFIETHDNGITLYECNVPRGPGSPQSSGTLAGLPRSYTTNRDIPCAEVEEQTRIQEIHATTNFYLVVNARLTSGRRIILGSRSELPLNIFVGVTIAYDVAIDYPALEQDLDDRDHARMRDKCMATVPTRHLGPDLNFEAFVRYMGTADFHGISHAAEPSYRRFLRFSEIVFEVLELYKEMITHRVRKVVFMSEQREVRRDVKSALGLFIQKLVDPCIVMSHVPADQHIDIRITMRGRSTRPWQVGIILCTYYCRVLRLTTKLYAGASDCGYKLHEGVCQDRVCKCERSHPVFTCISGSHSVQMIKCSNDIRASIAGSLNMGL